MRVQTSRAEPAGALATLLNRTASLLPSEPMDKNTVLVAVIALLSGFIGGFLLATKIDRSEIDRLRSQTPAQTQPGPNSASSDDQALSPEEIKAKIDEADKNPENFSFQKNLGIALYRYGAMKQDEKVINEAARILTRANALDPRDFDVLASLGNAQFDLGFAKEDANGFDKARANYLKALAIREDADVRTDLGISYFVADRPDLSKAAAELEKVAAANPRHDRSMQFLVQVYIKQNRLDDADKALAKLKEISPGNPALAELATQLNAAKSGRAS
jgi:tetratricopeptide (TPR) repeat protein